MPSDPAYQHLGSHGASPAYEHIPDYQQPGPSATPPADTPYQHLNTYNTDAAPSSVRNAAHAISVAVHPPLQSYSHLQFTDTKKAPYAVPEHVWNTSVPSSSGYELPSRTLSFSNSTNASNIDDEEI